MGTLLRAGDQLRATAQLVEAPGGTLLASHTVQSSLGDLFALQDDIARRIVEALSLPLAGDVTSPTPDAPRNPRAYELYLRANELARAYDGARPGARPVPARARAGSALRPGVGAPRPLPPGDRQVHRRHPGQRDARGGGVPRALALDPRLSVAHKFYATPRSGHRAGRSRRSCACSAKPTRHGNDPELFAGLVHACRYCGLYDEVDRRARRGAAARSERPDQPRADAADDRRHRAAARRRAAAGRRRRRRGHPGHGARAGRASRRGARARCSRCARRSRHSGVSSRGSTT